MQEHLTKHSNAIVLFSSGLDSTYNLLYSKDFFKELKVLFFNYEQKSFIKESEKVKALCSKLKLELIEIYLPYFKTFNSSLISKKQNIPNYESKNSITASNLTEWVPNRNGVFISIAAAIAENYNYKNIVVGFNKEEAELFPDNSKDFIKATNHALSFSTLNKVAVTTFSADFYKKDILIELNKLLKKNALRPEIVWTCYNSFEKMCGKCQSCVRLISAIKETKVGEGWEGLFLV